MSDASGPAVVEFGGEEPAPRRPFARVVARFAGDRRSVVALALAAAAMGVWSLVTRWYSITMPNGDSTDTGEPRDLTLAFGASDAGASSTAYLMGLMGLAVAFALVLFGPMAARRVARLGGIALAGTMVAVLVGVSLTYDSVGGTRFLFGPSVHYVFATHSGLVAAYLAAGLGGLGLILAEAPAATWSAPDGADPEPAAGWRPPRPARDETAAEVAAAAPIDLTVAPARPFARPADDEHRQR